MDKPLNPMDKQLIAARFAKARNTYTREARVQQQVAEKMMQLIKEPYTRFRRVVECVKELCTALPCSSSPVMPKPSTSPEKPT